MSVVVFLGPTLDLAAARKKILDATFLPPVAAGDICALLRRETPRAIAIIDGVFERVPSVWHKEILRALSLGVRVFGASSMGALRAAELHAFGMEGHGRIFEAYKSGEIEDDDEVAVAHGDASMQFRAVSEAMVNLRDALERAAREGIVSARERDDLVAASKARFYAERSWAGVLADCRKLGIEDARIERLRSWVRRERPNLQRDDAIGLLEQLSRAASDLAPVAASFVFHNTSFYVKLEQDVEERARSAAFVEGGESVSEDEICAWLRVASGGRADVLRTALFHFLVREHAERYDVSVSESGLADAHARAAHCEALREEDREEIAETEALIDELVARRASEVNAGVVLELARRGELEDLATIIIEERRKGAAIPSGRELAKLLVAYARRTGVNEPSPDSYAERVGVESGDAWLERAARQARRRRRAKRKR